TLGLVAGGILLAAGAGVGAVVLVTSGPLAQTDEDDRTPSAEESTQAPTAQLSPTPTTEPESGATPSPTAEPTVAGNEYGADGWPILDCPAGMTAARFESLRAAACSPVGWFVKESTNVDNPPGYTAYNLVMRPVAGKPGGVRIAFIAKSSGPPEALSVECLRPESTTLFGVPAVLCIDYEFFEPNGMTMGEGQLWGLEVFTESGDYYLKAEAAGSEPRAEAEALVDQALAITATARRNADDLVP
ncbi:MAG TPA: hypothetical protein VFK32_06550, partial [Tepidiformaceae bacterium]|nr:hypothetical protein [Tepidiformaceae bacterium]